MARIRTDNVFGVTTDNPLLVGGTTLNSAGLTGLGTVNSPDEAIIILDPNKVSGAPEIVVVTAHLSGATNATIARGQFGSVAREHAAGTEWVHGPIASNATAFTTAADDQGDFVPLGAWTTYAPSNTNITVGNGTQTARFMRVGRTIFFKYHLVWGNTTAYGGTIEVGLPVAASGLVSAAIGAGSAVDAGTRFFMVHGSLDGANGSQLSIVHTESGNTGAVNATNPMTWTTNDVLTITGVYEAAS